MSPEAVELAGVTVHAPVSVLTNLALSGQAAWLARGTVRPWDAFLRLLSLGALAGALKHGAHAGPIHDVARITSNLALGAAATWLASRRLPGRPHRLLTAAFGAWGALTVVVPSFLVVVAWMAGLVGAVGVAEACRALRGDPRARRFVAGMGMGSVAAALYLGGASLGPWLGPIDLAHLVLMAALPLLGCRPMGSPLGGRT